jgi:hypothetical protein
VAGSISEDSGHKLTNTKRILVYVLGPALIAGFFSVVPTIYTEIMKPRAALSYTEISGPSIPVSDGFRRIFGISIKNTGKVTLNNINVEFTVPNGEIESIVAEKSLLHPTISQQTSMTMVAVSRVLAEEKVNFSIMILSKASEPNLTIDTRSDEAVGKAQSIDSELGPITSYLAVIGATLSGISVAFMSGATFLFRRGRLGMLFGDKPDVITFIAGMSGVVPMTESMLVTDHTMSYARLADIFLFSGLRQDDTAKARCITGLEALLLINEISERSVAIIRANLSLLGIDYEDDEFQKIRKAATDLGERTLRRRIADKFCSLDNV